MAVGPSYLFIFGIPGALLLVSSPMIYRQSSVRGSSLPTRIHLEESSGYYDSLSFLAREEAHERDPQVVSTSDGTT